MLRRLTATKGGFTLVELMIVLVLLGLGFAALVNLFNITYKAFNKTEERYVKQEEVKRVAELLQNGTNISSSSSAEIYDNLSIMPPIGTKIKGAAYLYTDPNDGFLYVRESDTSEPRRLSFAPLYIYFKVIEKREKDGLLFPDSDESIPWENQCGLSCSISAVENNVTSFAYPLNSDDIYYTISVSYHFPNMLERESGRVNRAADGSVLTTPLINQSTGAVTALTATSCSTGNVVKFVSEMALISDDTTTEISVATWCFVATASYGEKSPDVGLLCDFRDNILKKTDAGKWFVKKYYTYSPPIAEKIAGSEPLRKLTRTALKPVVAAAYVALNPEWLIMIVPIAGAGVLALVRRKQKI